MSTSTDIGTLITSSPEIRGGRPRIAGTGVTVQSVVYRSRDGLTPEEIADSWEHITLGQVYAALAYYHANREEIDRQMSEDEAAAIEAERHWRKERGLPPI